MIDVMKRLAQLDATTPAIDTGAAVVRPEQGVIAECGPMGMMDGMGGMSQPHTPASINMTAATGEELSGMLKDIMSLAGINKGDAGGMDQLGVASEPMDLTAEPEIGPDAGAGPGATDGEVMRSVLDKLNPEDGDKADGEQNPFGGDDSQNGDDGVNQAHGDIDNDGDHDMDDHDAEKSEPQDGEEDDKEKAEETYAGPQYSTTPNDPNKDRQGYDQEGIGPNNHENQPGAGNTMFGKTRTSVQPTATFENLMKEYKSFIGEAEEEETDEGIMDKAKAFGKKVLDKVGHGDDEDMIKDLQKKAGVPQTGKKPEPANESMADILKLSGLK